MVKCRLISPEELADRRSFGRKKGNERLYLEPGMMWFCPEIWDHQDPDLEQYLHDLIRDVRVRQDETSLSLNYLTQWATKRDPLCVMLPGEVQFYPDAAAPGCKGWEVTGRVPAISLNKTVVVQRTRTYAILKGEIMLPGHSHVG